MSSFRFGIAKCDAKTRTILLLLETVTDIDYDAYTTCAYTYTLKKLMLGGPVFGGWPISAEQELRLCLSKAHVRATRECLLQPRIRSSGITRFIEVGSTFSAILSTSMYTKTTKCIWLVRVGLLCQLFQHGTSSCDAKEFRMHVIRKRKSLENL